MLRDIDEFDSHGVRTLADKIACGKLSVTAAAECTDAFVSDGANKALGAEMWFTLVGHLPPNNHGHFLWGVGRMS